jgi:drug/metabolite transporter (DMT)-like permease
MLVNYLLPCFALFFGVTILDESLTVAKLAGLVLILAGVTLASGLVGRRVLRNVPAETG